MAKMSERMARLNQLPHLQILRRETLLPHHQFLQRETRLPQIQILRWEIQVHHLRHPPRETQGVLYCGL